MRDVDRVAVAPDDDERERLAKAIITLSACLVTALSTVWNDFGASARANWR